MPNVDRYTHPLRTRHRDVKRANEAYVHQTFGDVVSHGASTASTLMLQLERNVAETEKKWSWIASSFDDGLSAAGVPNPMHNHEVVPEPTLPMPQPLSPFSLSSIPHFAPTKSPDTSLATADSEQDTSAGDLSLYRWLSAQGAQTIVPGPPPAFTPPPNKRVSALNHLARRRPHAPATPSPEENRANATTGAAEPPLSPPPSGRLLFSAQFDTPEQPLPLSLALAAGRRSAPDFLPVSPPATPVIAQFRETKELTALPVHADDSFACATDEDLLPSPRSFDLGHALSRNLSLQHASSAALRSYKLVVQEFKAGAFPSRRGGVDFGLVSAAREPAFTKTEGSLSVSTEEDSSTLEFAGLLARQAADEELQAERLRALADRLHGIARERRRLAAKVLSA